MMDIQTETNCSTNEQLKYLFCVLKFIAIIVILLLAQFSGTFLSVRWNLVSVVNLPIKRDLCYFNL